MARNHLNKNSTQRRDPLSTELIGVRSAPMALHPKLRAPGRLAVAPPVRSQCRFFSTLRLSLEKGGPNGRVVSGKFKQSNFGDTLIPLRIIYIYMGMGQNPGTVP